MLRNGTVYTARVHGSRAVGSLLVPPDDGPWRLGMSSYGTFENLRLERIPDADAPLGPGQVRVALSAIAANFRDVMIALGLYPDPDAVMGIEASGVVLETGPETASGDGRFAVGDRVMGLFPDGTGTVATTDQRLLVKVPAGWSHTAAATTSVVFATAYYALVDLAGVKPGQRVLVHAAAGGVGMAAVQLARHFGLEVFATASRGKWDTLRAMGFDDDHISDSRSCEFEDKFRTVTGGRGMDVVLDSLSGDFVDASLRLVAPGGVFLEMGKTDIRDPEVVARDHAGVRYRAFDLFEAGPERIQQMLDELAALFGEDVLQPLPVTRFDVRRAPAALRYLSQARHVGKVVMTMPDALGGGHGADHGCDRDGGFGTGTPRRGPARCAQLGADEPARSGCARGRGADDRADCGRCPGAGGGLRRGRPRGAGQGARRYPGAATAVGSDSRGRGARRRGHLVVDAGTNRCGVARQGRCGVEPARADP